MIDVRKWSMTYNPAIYIIQTLIHQSKSELAKNFKQIMITASIVFFIA